ncbi:MAG: hypothetical protein PWP23_3202 [Candidatus Sumerlaeota bacterium]|nr:hypothetical protein [Candidatus Sumerlaeota bacterium]
MPQIEETLEKMGCPLPPVAKPVAAYIPAIRTGNLVMTSGQLPMVGGKLDITGKVGEDVAPEAAAQLARIACLNALAAVKEVIGDLDAIVRVVRVVVFVQSSNNFHGQPAVANGASEFLQAIFGEAGRHVRSAVGTNALPLNAPVELELTVEVK